MQVKINDDFYIETDERNYVLKQRVLRAARDGSGFNEYFSYFYYPNIEQLCDAVVRKAPTGMDLSNVAELKAFMLSLKSEIKTCIESRGLAMVHRYIEAKRANPDQEVSGANVPVRAKRGPKPGSKRKAKK